MKYYVVSDIHGYYSILVKSLGTAGYFDDKDEHKLIILGDLFDRGHEAKELQEFVLERMEKDQVILIRGNHEDLFTEFCTTDKACRYRHHVTNGTYDTALQLTDFFMEDAYEHPLKFALACRSTAFYQTIIPSMISCYETEHYIFTHGWIPVNHDESGAFSPRKDWRSASAEEWARARWYNGMDAAVTSEEAKTVICGHWHASYGHARYENKGTEFGPDADFSPYYGKGIIAIDACTAYSGIINCLVLEDE